MVALHKTSDSYYENSLQKNKIEHYTVASLTTRLFTEESNQKSKSSDLMDMFSIKVDISKDRIDLILGEIRMRERITKQNLESLYKDLMQVDIWRMQLKMPLKYEHDKAWIEHNKMELNIRDKIRAEIKDFARDTSLTFKDLRESLLKHKMEAHKLKILDTKDLEEMIDGVNQNYQITEEGDN